MTTRRVAVIQTAYIGDVVLATPLAEAVKQTLPGAEVTFVVIPATANLVEHHRFVDRVLVFDKRGNHRGLRGLRRFARNLRGFDVALIPHRSIRSAALAFWARIPMRVGFDISAGSFLFSHTTPYRPGHELERNLSLLSAIGLQPLAATPRIDPDGGDCAVVTAILGRNGRGPRVAMAPGSIWPTKRWPAEHFVSLARMLQRRLGASIVLVGSAQDRALCRQILAGAGEETVDASGRLTLRQSAELLRRCQVAVTNDSAPAHLAAAMGTPVVALFGPTTPAFGFSPFGEGHRILERPLPCRPCSRHGGRHCPIGTFECMRSISPAEVAGVVEEMLAPRKLEQTALSHSTARGHPRGRTLELRTARAG